MSNGRLLALLRITLTLAAAVGLWLAITRWIGDRSSLPIDWVGDRPIELLAPRWLLLVSVVPVFYLLRAVSLTDLSVAQQVVQASLRSLVVAGVAIALARPAWITTQTKVSTVALVDVSDSVSDRQLAAAKRYVDSLGAGAGEADFQVITFAEKARVARSEDGQPPSTAIRRHPGEGAGTDVQSAMQLAYGLFPDGYLPRIVVISDGNQTVGDIAVESYRAKELGVRVSWRTFAQDKTSEVRVAGVIVPDDLKTGQPYDVTAEVWSTDAQRVTLTLQQDEWMNPLEPAKTVDLRDGKNLIKFRSEARRAGATTYTVRLANAARDTEKHNNAAVMTAPVKGRPNILYVEGGMLREPSTAGYFARALEHEHMDVSVRGPAGLPSTARELEKFDLVVVSDVPAHLVGTAQMNALDHYVASGGGLIMAGGQDSFGSGGYRGTRMEQIMPVRFDGKLIKEQPDVALCLVIDRSGSMEGPKLEAAKEAARATTEVLAPRDIISVVAFDSEPHVFVPPQRAANKMRISASIARLTSSGGTSFFPALKEAQDLLEKIEAKVKHVILLSDGEAPTDGIAELVGEMRAQRMTVSTVGVAGANPQLLTMIAEVGGGRFHAVDDLGSLPRIFMKETHEAMQSPLVEDVIHVRVAKRVEAIEGTAVETAPPLHGYVTTLPKHQHEEIILISDAGEPILARWKHGAGTSVAWTSDVKNRWSSDWIRWGGYAKFWGQVVRSSMRRKGYDSYELTASVRDGRAVVVVDAFDSSDRFVNELVTRLQVVDPASGVTVQELPMNQTAAGRYTADFRIERYGSYLLKAIHQRRQADGKLATVAESLGGVALSYPLEYLRTTPDVGAMRHAAHVSGGVDQGEPATIWDASRDEPVAYMQDLWPYVLLGVVGLFLLDLYVKRVRLFGYRPILFTR